jgi:hypothetical protein
MAQILREDLWTRVRWPGLYLVTTNSVLNARGLLIMGRGSAREARDRIPGIQAEIVQIVQPTVAEDYGFRVIRDPRRDGHFGFGVFQTKRDWRHVAYVETILKSLGMLDEYAVANPDVLIRCPLPAVGCGQIGTGTPPDSNEIRALCLELPDNVTFCVKGN